MRKLFLNDGVSLSLFEASLRDALIASESLMEVVMRNEMLRQDKIDFVGFLEDAGSDLVIVFLPKTIDVSPYYAPLLDQEIPEPLVQSSRLTLETLAAFARERPRDQDGPNVSGNREQSSTIDRFATAIALINDWKLNGVFTAKTVYSGRSIQGRIDWKQTLSKTLPCTIDGVPLYPDAIKRRSAFDPSAPIPQIHRSCVLKALEICGWLVSDSLAVRSDIQEGLQAVPSFGGGMWLSILRQSLSEEFSEDRLRTLRLLIAFLESSGPEQRPLVCGTNAFHRVWQRMCSVVLGDEYQQIFQPLLPQPRFFGDDGQRLGAPRYGRVRQIPDIIYEEPELHALVVADAKYYDPQLTAPGWDDVGKQILYAISANTLREQWRIINCFVFPLRHGSATARNIRLCLPSGTPVEGIPEITCIYWHIDELMMAYLRPSLSERRRFRRSIVATADIAPGSSMVNPAS